MRILHVVASLAPRHGGPTEAALGMVRSLRSEGIDASILSSNDDVGQALDVPLNVWTTYQDLPCLFLPRVPARQHTLVGFTYAPQFKPWLREHVRDYDFIHIHTVFSYPANIAMSAARAAGVPYAVRPLGQLCRWSMTQRALVKKLQLAFATRRNIDGAAFIHTTSQMEALETAERGFKSPCKVLPHGLSMPPPIPRAREELRQELGIPPDRPIVVFMSRFHEKKGIELLLHACAQLRDLDFELVLAGTGDEAYVSHLKDLTATLELNNVRWHGFATGERKWRLLHGGDLFVLPSHSENFGIAVLEAAACGLPVIVSDQVALADEVASSAIGQVVPLQVDLLADAMRRLLADPQARAAMSARATALVRDQFTPSAAARRLVAAYQEFVPCP